MPCQGVSPSGPPHLHRTRASERAEARLDRPDEGAARAAPRPRLGVAGGAGHGPCWWRLRAPQQGRLSDSRLVAFEGLRTTVQSVATVLSGSGPGPGGALRPVGPDPVAGPGVVGIRQLPAAAMRFPPSPSATRPIRSLVVSVHPVRLSAVGAAQVGSQVQPVTRCAI